METTVASPAASRLQRVLAASQLFSGLDPTVLERIGASAVSRKLERGERVWRAGEAATHFILIQSGIVKIMRAAPDGTEAIVALFGPRESIGDVAVVGHRKYPADAVVASDNAEILRIPAETVLALMATRPDVSAAVNRSLVEHTQALQEKIRVMSAGSVPKRLATLFLALAERFGDEGEDGTTVIPLALSRSELACLVGARVETTIRTVRRWEKASLLTTHPDGFHLHDVEALVARTRSDSDDDD